jgi:ubiquinone/menaquinone biosynthesis C-methylase UbiE
MLSIDDMRKMYERQARLTKGIRYHTYRTVGLSNGKRVLDVGSGAGAVAREIAERSGATVVAVESMLALLSSCKIPGGVLRVAGDGKFLPFEDCSFDTAVCHFFLLWAKDPQAAVSEMTRVVRPGGWVAALAEPDYGGWIDHPAEVEIGKLLAERLVCEGADPQVGRKLKGLFAKAGLDAEVGVSAGIWDSERLKAEFDEEWRWRSKILGESPLLEETRRKEWEAITSGERILFIPIFYASARKP